MLKTQLILLIIFYPVQYLCTRAYVVSARDFLQSKASTRKYRRGRSAWEWLTFASMRHRLPRILLVHYWLVTLMHPCAMLACLLLNAGGHADLGYWVMGGTLGVDCFILLWSCFTFGLGRGDAHRRSFEKWMNAWKSRRKNR